MRFNKKAINVFWVVNHGISMREYGDYNVGDTFSSALSFTHPIMEPSESATKSLKKVDIDTYEGVGRIFVIENFGDYPTLLFDCGIYAFSLHNRLPAGIESGSYVKMRFYLAFDERHFGTLITNGEFLHKLIPEMDYDWRVKDILILIDDDAGKKNFAHLPVAYTSSKGEIYKRIRETNAYEDCDGYDASYILICEMI
ncbi:MAG: hypothetical protein L7F77_11050 [Candidatus Magnetominusculus sp. LBB02]|nr:hypothetical protein [Candidatus Magnetominusculus sp. LBB02]